MKNSTLTTCAAIVMVALTTGCASITGDTTHPMRVDTLASGKAVRGAHCKLTNDYGQVSVKSGDTLQVRPCGGIKNGETQQSSSGLCIFINSVGRTSCPDGVWCCFMLYGASL